MAPSTARATNPNGISVGVLRQTLTGRSFERGSDPVGRRIRVRNAEFKIIGVMASKGLWQHPGSGHNVVFVPFRTGQQRLSGGTSVGSIQVQVDTSDNIGPSWRR